MSYRRATSLLPALCLILALLAGCSRSPRVTFYTLSSVSPAAEGGPLPISVTVGPASLPALVDQPQLVVRSGPNRVEILESSRWAEPLRSGIPRIMAADLTLLLPQARVSAYPQNAGSEADYRVQVDIQRFEMTAGEGVELELLWTVRRTGEGIPKSGRSVVSEPAGAGGYDLLVAAQSRALAVACRDLEGALRSLAVGPR